MTKGFAIETFQDVAPYLRANKRMYHEHQLTKSQPKAAAEALGWHKASIPEVILHKFMKEFQAMRKDPFPPRLSDKDFKEFLAKKLRDPDWRYLRVDGRKY